MEHCTSIYGAAAPNNGGNAETVEICVVRSKIGLESSNAPPIVERKIRIGDWEGDTVVGKHHQGALVILVDRKSKLTVDNGKEFSNHESVARTLEIKVFFADPYSAWQRGLNENTNGLIRQYVPNG